MKPASILLLAAAGLSSALPAQPGTINTGVQARDSRSLFGHAIHAIAARNLVPLNANTAAPPPAADPAADKKAPAAAPPAATPTDKKAGDAKATDSKAGDAKATDAAATTTAAAVTTTAAATDAATTDAATTTTAAPAIETTSVAIGNGTASDNGKGKGNGKGNGKDNGKGKNQGQGKGKHNNNNNNNNGNNALSAAIAGALNTLGLDGVLDASSLDKLSVGNQISLLAQIVSLQTMKDLQMVGGQDIVVVLNQGFRSNGLNVIINA
ncbi:hypothetical protein V8C34DRAFT_323498 [Trichoderma compactum]